MKSRFGGPETATMLAGWLFADLAIGLVIILLTSIPAMPSTSPGPTPSTSPSATPTPDVPPGVEQDPVKFTLTVRPARLTGKDSREAQLLQRKILRYLEEKDIAGRRAAFVLTFAGSSDPDDGVGLAHTANSVLRRAAPHLMTRAAVRDFWQGLGSGVRHGTLSFEIYLFVEN